jgi:hypothetical protein
MAKPPKKWQYILIELEIDERVIDTRIASQSTFDYMYNYLLRSGQTQSLPWTLFISKYNHVKPRVINSGICQDRDRHGRFIKIETINHSI